MDSWHKQVNCSINATMEKPVGISAMSQNYVYQEMRRPLIEENTSLLKRFLQLLGQICHSSVKRQGYSETPDLQTGRKIAPNTGANATEFFTLATKS